MLSVRIFFIVTRGETNSIGIVNWFKAIRNRKKAGLAQFDMVDYYTSICKKKEKLLDKSLTFAVNFIEISEQDEDIILHARNTLLLSENGY